MRLVKEDDVEKQTKITGCKVKSRIHFSPDPEVGFRGTKPTFVESRLVRDILEYPKDVEYVTFEDVVAVGVQTFDQVNGAVSVTLHTRPVNDSMFIVAHTAQKADAIRTEGWHEIEVHPNLKGKVWVFGRAHQVAEQKAA